MSQAACIFFLKSCFNFLFLLSAKHKLHLMRILFLTEFWVIVKMDYIKTILKGHLTLVWNNTGVYPLNTEF